MIAQETDETLVRQYIFLFRYFFVNFHYVWFTGHEQHSSKNNMPQFRLLETEAILTRLDRCNAGQRPEP